MSQALQLHTDTMADWQIIRQQAEILIKTNFLPQSIKTPEQVMAIILTGRELGIGAMQALNTINVIVGRPTISPQLMLALINRSGELEDFLVTDDGQCCAVTMKRRGRQPHVETFSMKDAALMKTTEGYGDNKKTIPLSEKYNWKQQPAVMRKWRAIAACARVVFPDVILGLYTPDEMGAQTDEETGEVVTLPPEVGEPVPLVVCVSCNTSLSDSGDCPNCDVVMAEPERASYTTERQVKLEGAQPMPLAPPDKWPQNRKYAHVFGKCAALKFASVDLANYIQMKFKMAVSDDPVAALDALSALQLKELDQALAGEFQSRNRTR